MPDEQQASKTQLGCRKRPDIASWQEPLDTYHPSSFCVLPCMFALESEREIPQEFACLWFELVPSGSCKELMIDWWRVHDLRIHCCSL
jgi:hypothetical protein